MITDGSESKMPWYFVVFVVISTFTCASGCSCIPFDPEVDFCAGTSGFAAVFRINGNYTVDRGRLVYDVDILHEFKFKTQSVNVETEKLYTFEIAGACGAYLQGDSYYIITGYFIERPGKPTQMMTELFYIRDYFKENPIVNGNPPPCERTVPNFAIQ